MRMYTTSINRYAWAAEFGEQLLFKKLVTPTIFLLSLSNSRPRSAKNLVHLLFVSTTGRNNLLYSVWFQALLCGFGARGDGSTLCFKV